MAILLDSGRRRLSRALACLGDPEEATPTLPTRTVPRPWEDPEGAGVSLALGLQSPPGPESPAPPPPRQHSLSEEPEIRAGLTQRPCSLPGPDTSPSTSCLRASAMPRTSSGGLGLPGRDPHPAHATLYSELGKPVSRPGLRLFHRRNWAHLSYSTLLQRDPLQGWGGETCRAGGQAKARLSEELDSERQLCLTLLRRVLPGSCP